MHVERPDVAESAEEEISAVDPLRNSWATYSVAGRDILQVTGGLRRDFLAGKVTHR